MRNIILFPLIPFASLSSLRACAVQHGLALFNVESGFVSAIVLRFPSKKSPVPPLFSFAAVLLAGILPSMADSTQIAKMANVVAKAADASE